MSLGEEINRVQCTVERYGIVSIEILDRIERKLDNAAIAKDSPARPTVRPQVDKIEAIRLVRLHTSCNLKEAKDAVEAIMAHWNL